jgi:putative ABC transport system permease protein
VRKQVFVVDPEQPVYGIDSMDQIVAESLMGRRASTFLLAIFAALATLLTCVGTYGVISYSVSQRTHEFGIRMALGAEPRHVLGMVMGQGAKVALAGVAIGLAGAVGLTRLMASLLFGVTATDPVTYAAVAILLAAVAVAASFLPVRRALRVDATTALRHE